MQQIITHVQAMTATPQLAIQAAPANNNTTQAAGTFPQQQPQHDVQIVAHDAYPTARGHINMIQKGRPSNRAQKLITRQVLQATTSPRAVPDYLRGSETAITFSKADHPLDVPRPGHAALVIEALIGD